MKLLFIILSLNLFIQKLNCNDYQLVHTLMIKLREVKGLQFVRSENEDGDYITYNYILKKILDDLD